MSQRIFNVLAKTVTQRYNSGGTVRPVWPDAEIGVLVLGYYYLEPPIIEKIFL